MYWTADRVDEFCLKTAAHAGMKPGDVIAFGHTHLPWHREVGGFHFVNTGSVGRPKDGDWRAGYVLLDVGSGAVGVEFIRVEAMSLGRCGPYERAICQTISPSTCAPEGAPYVLAQCAAAAFGVEWLLLFAILPAPCDKLGLAFKGQFLMVGRPDATVRPSAGGF